MSRVLLDSYYEMYKFTFLQYKSLDDIYYFISNSVRAYQIICTGCADVFDGLSFHACLFRNPQIHSIMKYAYLDTEQAFHYEYYWRDKMNFYYEKLSNDKIINNPRYLTREEINKLQEESDLKYSIAGRVQEMLLLQDPYNAEQTREQLELARSIYDEYKNYSLILNNICELTTN